MATTSLPTLAIVATLALAPRVAHAEVSPRVTLALLGYLTEAAQECHYRATVQPIVDAVNDMHVPYKFTLEAIGEGTGTFIEGVRLYGLNAACKEALYKFPTRLQP